MEEELEEQEKDIWLKIFNTTSSLNNIEISNYFNVEPIFNDVLSRNSLPGIKYGAYVINLEDKDTKGTHWFSLFIKRNLDVSFNSFGNEYIPSISIKQNRR